MNRSHLIAATVAAAIAAASRVAHANDADSGAADSSDSLTEPGLMSVSQEVVIRRLYNHEERLDDQTLFDPAGMRG